MSIEFYSKVEGVRSDDYLYGVKRGKLGSEYAPVERKQVGTEHTIFGEFDIVTYVGDNVMRSYDIDADNVDVFKHFEGTSGVYKSAKLGTRDSKLKGYKTQALPLTPSAADEPAVMTPFINGLVSRMYAAMGKGAIDTMYHDKYIHVVEFDVVGDEFSDVKVEEVERVISELMSAPLFYVGDVFNSVMYVSPKVYAVIYKMMNKSKGMIARDKETGYIRIGHTLVKKLAGLGSELDMLFVKDRDCVNVWQSVESRFAYEDLAPEETLIKVEYYRENSIRDGYGLAIAHGNCALLVHDLEDVIGIRLNGTWKDGGPGEGPQRKKFKRTDIDWYEPVDVKEGEDGGLGTCGLKYIGPTCMITEKPEEGGEGTINMRVPEVAYFDAEGKSYVESEDGEYVEGVKGYKVVSLDNFMDRVEFEDEVERLKLYGGGNVKSMVGAFERVNVERIDLSGLDTSSVEDMGKMFNGCFMLSEIDMRGLDTSKVTNMGNVFAMCESLNELDLSDFDTSNVNSMRRMFIGCGRLKRLDLSNFDTSRVKDMYGMFMGCNRLDLLDIRGFDMSGVGEIDKMFDDLGERTSGTTLKVGCGFDLERSREEGKLPDDAEIVYVEDCEGEFATVGNKIRFNESGDVRITGYDGEVLEDIKLIGEADNTVEGVGGVYKVVEGSYEIEKKDTGCVEIEMGDKKKSINVKGENPRWLSQVGNRTKVSSVGDDIVIRVEDGVGEVKFSMGDDVVVYDKDFNKSGSGRYVTYDSSSKAFVLYAIRINKPTYIDTELDLSYSEIGKDKKYVMVG